MKTVNSSQLAQMVGINELAESMMAFNTNYKDTGLFGVYAVAKVCDRSRSFENLYFLAGVIINDYTFGGKRLALCFYHLRSRI